MVRAARNKNVRNKNVRKKRSYSSMHYDSPVTRSRAAILDLFENYPSNSSMFSDPARRSVVVEEMAKNPGKILTRNMVTKLPIREIDDLVKSGKQPKRKARAQPKTAPVLRDVRSRSRKSSKSSQRKRSVSTKERNRRSRSTAERKNGGAKWKRRGVKQTQVAINDAKPPSLEQEVKRKTVMTYETQGIDDGRRCFPAAAVDNVQTQLNKLKLGEQDTGYEPQATENDTLLKNEIRYGRWQDRFCPPTVVQNGASLRNDIRYGRGQEKFCPPRGIENSTSLRNDIRYGGDQNQFFPPQNVENGASLRNDIKYGQGQNQFYPPQAFENGTSLRMDKRFGMVQEDPSRQPEYSVPIRNNINLGRHQNYVHAARTMENGVPLRNGKHFSKHTNVPEARMGTHHVEYSTGFKATPAREPLKIVANSNGRAFGRQGVGISPREKNGETKALYDDCDKRKSISLWFGNAVSSVSSYVSRYMHFRS